MLKSLFSGVSGLQSHQIAMDVESNNIANVNTVGFKYSRANFSDLLAQTNQIATAPQGELGGKNAMQVGLGTSASSVTRIHSQGSIQNTDKNTDVAIQGDGYFVVSGDGGSTYKYTRSGDFKFDASGNFVDNNGFIVQGWMRDEDTGVVDSTAPIGNVQVPAGLTTPANASSEITLKANLNSGSTVVQYNPTFSLDSTGTTADVDAYAEDMGYLFNASGEAFNLVAGQGLQMTLDPTASPVVWTSFIYDPNGDGLNNDGTFQTVNGLREELQEYIQNDPNGDAGAVVTVTAEGKFQIDNTGGAGALNINVQDIAANPNERFAANFSTFIGSIQMGATKNSQAVNAATHSSSIDVFDSLGSKHTVKMDFRKQSGAAGTTWVWSAEVPKPGDLNTNLTPYENRIWGGTVQFDENGAMSGYNPPNLDFTANNGSSKNQNINLDFGSIGGFDGVTSFDSTSATSGISQDGYPGGDLLGIRIDQSGTLIGSFSNGRSFGLAQISMAKFANNEGLVGDGSNVYLQSANSGSPIVGSAATAGRGFMQSSALEASNVDLSKSLTNLIIIQRGYQANGKTITTSDTLLETLIGLKR
ncbi:MAG: flagellar hook-basal body complex protein [Campylobacterota bacterium]|nr:flagellar hook-basal body complex protein [Campylobacterota bacterium]